MLNVDTDPAAEAIYIELSDEPIGYTEELDVNRLIDRTLDGKPVGIDLTSVSHGVKLSGLPEVDGIENFLKGLGIKIIKEETGEEVAHSSPT